MANCTLTLLLTDIERSLATTEAHPSMPALQTLLSKGRREPMPADFSSFLFDLFRLQSEPGQDRPVASLSASGDGLDASTGWWLRADPVHLVADRDQLYLSAGKALEVTRSEADALVAELNRLYAEDGWQFFAPTPGRWYLRLPEGLVMRTTPTTTAMGRRVGEVLPQGSDALVFQRAMTEMQMLLHSSPVNARRSEQGLLEVNSLWFWGGGALPNAARESAWDRVVVDDPLIRGLATLHGIGSESAPSLPEFPLSEGRVVWQSAIASPLQAEQALFAPLLARLRTGELAQLQIVLPGQGCWLLDRAALRRWWRRLKPLSALLQGAA